MAESNECPMDQINSLSYLLQCLGVTINTKKIIMEPTQPLECFKVNISCMELSLPAKKMKKIQAEARKFEGEDSVEDSVLAQAW